MSGVLLSVLVITGCSYGGGCVQGYGAVTNEFRDMVDFTGVSFADDFEVRVSKSTDFEVEVQAQENLHQMIEIYVSGSTLVVKTKNNSCISSIAPIIVYVSLPYLEEIRNTGSGKLSADRAESAEFECSNSGSGLIRIDSVFASTVSLKNSGSGDLNVTASYTDEIEVIQTGSGMVDAGFMFSPLGVSINHTSSGKIYATVLDGLEVVAKLTGSGIINLSGDAETADLGLSSSGKIDALEMEVADAKVQSSGSGKVFVFATETLDVTITGSGDVYYRGNPLVSARVTGSGSVRPY